MKFEGQFTPPEKGGIHFPIHVSGPGFIQADDDHLLVSGFSYPQSVSELFSYRSELAAVVFTFCFFYSLLLDGDSIPTEILVGIAVIFAIAILWGRSIKVSTKHNEDKPILYKIPWNKIKKIEPNPHDSEMVLIVVKRFKPKGALYFTPQNSSKQVIEEITEFIKP